MLHAQPLFVTLSSPFYIIEVPCWIRWCRSGERLVLRQYRRSARTLQSAPGARSLCHEYRPNNQKIRVALRDTLANFKYPPIIFNESSKHLMIVGFGYT